MEVKIVVGYGYGRFKNDKNEMQDYCNVFVLEDFVGDQNNDYHYEGQKAIKYKCVSPEVFKGISVGSRIKCYFDSRGRISDMIALDQK